MNKKYILIKNNLLINLIFAISCGTSFSTYTGGSASSSNPKNCSTSTTNTVTTESENTASSTPIVSKLSRENKEQFDIQKNIDSPSSYITTSGLFIPSYKILQWLKDQQTINRTEFWQPETAQYYRKK